MDGEGAYKNSMCEPTESCAKWTETNTVADKPVVTNKEGCILSMYCEMALQWKEVDTTFTCPEGVNKGASKLAVSVGAAIALVFSMWVC